MDESQVYAAAERAGARWPELVVAQWKLESACGTKLSGKNNLFGLKGSGTAVLTTEYVNNKEITIKDNFIDFDSQEACVQYLVDRWYKDWRGYRGINRAESPAEAAKLLQSEGYATDPNYASKLISIMPKETQHADLLEAAKYFKGEPHQVKAFQDLQASLTAEQRSQFTKTWRSASAEPAISPANEKPRFPLSVPYFWQRDSKTGQGERSCQSSAIAMRIEQIDPKIIGDDDSYLRIVNRYGDTVSQAAHQKALDHLGLKHQFRQNGTEKLLCDLLDKGIAVPIGILHKGPISKPSGGGHWITLIGYDATHFYVNDPYGSLDLINGGYPEVGPTDGKGVKYTRKNLMKRWLISSKSDGWLWIIEK